MQYFSAMFNHVYHSIPTDIKPSPSLVLLHYLDTFDLEITFQLRERNTTTLKEMQDNEIDVEANLFLKRSNLKEEVMENIEKEHLTSSKVKLEILVITMEEMMQNIIMTDELFFFQKLHVPIISKEEDLLTLTIILLILVTIDQKMIVLCIHLWIVMKMDL